MSIDVLPPTPPLPEKWGRVRWHFDNRNVSMWGIVDGGLFFATTVTTRSPFPYFSSSAPPPCPPRDGEDSDLMEPCTRFARSSVGGWPAAPAAPATNTRLFFVCHGHEFILLNVASLQQ